jgi:hypothetical protein
MRQNTVSRCDQTIIAAVMNPARTIASDQAVKAPQSRSLRPLSTAPVRKNGSTGSAPRATPEVRSAASMRPLRRVAIHTRNRQGVLGGCIGSPREPSGLRGSASGSSGARRNLTSRA